MAGWRVMLVIMIIAALVIGAISAYYFGIRIGAFAAVGSVGLFVFGIVMPSKIIWAYGLVGAYVLAVLVVGPRLPGRQQKKADFFRILRVSSSALRRTYRRFRN